MLFSNDADVRLNRFLPIKSWIVDRVLWVDLESSR